MCFYFFFLMIRRPPRSTLFTRRSSDLPSSQIVGNVVAGGSECRVSRRRDRERKPSEYPYADVHRRPADRPPRLPYLHIADAGRFQFHAASRRSGFSRQANAAKRRSEERRVGKEERARVWTDHYSRSE